MPIPPLTITIDDNGQVALSGPIDNKLITLGMLELAKECLVRYHEQKERRVQVAGPEELSKIGMKLVGGN